MTNDLENKLNELEKLCEEFTLRIQPSPASLDIRQAYGAAMLTIEQMPKLIKALKASVNQLKEIAKTDCTCGADDYPNEPVELCYGHEGLQEIQQIMCGGEQCVKS